MKFMYSDLCSGYGEQIESKTETACLCARSHVRSSSAGCSELEVAGKHTDLTSPLSVHLAL